VTDWTVHAARLADELTTSGKLWSAPWQAAVRAVPRHALVPVHYHRVPGTDQWIHADTAADLDLVYSNTALFVLPDGLSSTSMPALMTRMLEALDIHDGHDVLEIGAGTGYNAALLSHRLGDQHVFAIDIEPTLIQLARERLARIGYHPTLATANGANGLAEHAPYDRIIATCSVPAVPWPWVEQTREGGLILADIKLAPLAGNLVLLRLRQLHGHAPQRRDLQLATATPHPPGPNTARTTTLDITRPWEHPVLWFLAHFHLPPASHSGCAARTQQTTHHDVPVRNGWLLVRDRRTIPRQHTPSPGSRAPPTVAHPRRHPRHLAHNGPTRMGTIRAHHHRHHTANLAGRTPQRPPAIRPAPPHIIGTVKLTSRKIK
jgi:protein-L-isoaspartate(D-aspartate) O-methyltransferase